jgi:hypothetical protein
VKALMPSAGRIVQLSQLHKPAALVIKAAE